MQHDPKAVRLHAELDKAKANTQRNIAVNAASADHAQIAVQREMAKRGLGGRVIGTFPGSGLEDDHVAIVVTSDIPHDRVTWIVKIEVS